MKHLHILPRFSDRWSHLYLEHGKLDKENDSLVLHDKEGSTPIPVDQLCVVFLGPGTSISHAAVKLLADNNCQLYWTGEEGVRMYAFGIGGTHSAHRLLRQAKLFSNEQERLGVVKRMYQKRFTNPIPADATVEQIRGMEGARVRDVYRQISEKFNVEWHGRVYDQKDWNRGDPMNRALSSSNACLYGICHAAILSAGYSPAIGFIHVGKMLSFVYDIADLYKTELSIPVAFEMAAASSEDVEGRTRRRCRDLFHQNKLMDRILPDIAEVLDARDDLEESPGELEGRAVSLAGGTGDGSLFGEPQRART
jgi:CRISPR-associated protein Cas1